MRTLIQVIVLDEGDNKISQKEFKFDGTQLPENFQSEVQELVLGTKIEKNNLL